MLTLEKHHRRRDEATRCAGVSYLVSGGFVRGHVTLQLRAVAEGVGAQRAGEALLVLLVPIFDVFLQRRQALVAAVAVWTGEQLGEVVRCAGQQVCSQRSKVRPWRLMGNLFVICRFGFWTPRLTVLALVLSDGLGRAQSRHLLRGFWVNDGGVAALQVLGDGCWVTVALLQFTFQEVLVQLGDAFQTLH